LEDYLLGNIRKPFCILPSFVFTLILRFKRLRDSSQQYSFLSHQYLQMTLRLKIHFHLVLTEWYQFVSLFFALCCYSCIHRNILTVFLRPLQGIVNTLLVSFTSMLLHYWAAFSFIYLFSYTQRPVWSLSYYGL